jgi:hypothetical protein
VAEILYMRRVVNERQRELLPAVTVVG